MGHLSFSYCLLLLQPLPFVFPLKGEQVRWGENETKGTSIDSAKICSILWCQSSSTASSSFSPSEEVLPVMGRRRSFLTIWRCSILWIWCKRFGQRVRAQTRSEGKRIFGSIYYDFHNIKHEDVNYVECLSFLRSQAPMVRSINQSILFWCPLLLRFREGLRYRLTCNQRGDSESKMCDLYNYMSRSFLQWIAANLVLCL